MGKSQHKRSRDGNRHLKIVFHHADIRAIQDLVDVEKEFLRVQRRKGKTIARDHRERTRDDRVFDADQIRILQRKLSWTTTNTDQALPVAALGKPACLTDDFDSRRTDWKSSVISTANI